MTTRDQDWHQKGPGETSRPFTQLIHLKRCGPEPLYYQLAQSLERAVAAGTIPPGTRLLPENEMARELKLSVATVRRAWAYLERRGLLTRRRKRGTFVVWPLPGR